MLRNNDRAIWWVKIMVYFAGIFAGFCVAFFKAFLRSSAIGFTVILTLGLWHTALAASTTVVVGNDTGGAVRPRVALIQDYQRKGIHLEIRGDYCLSACTMYLALRTTCVLPTTKFGFHGPSSQVYGISLGPKAFDHWSRIMAAHYPEPIRSWYLKKGRNRTVGFHVFLGRDLIAMGVRQCANRRKGPQISDPKES